MTLVEFLKILDGLDFFLNIASSISKINIKIKFG